MSSENVINYQQEMEALEARSRRASAVQLPYTEAYPFPVKAGPGHVSKGNLKRLPGDRAYGARQLLSNNSTTSMIEFPEATRFKDKGSGIIIGAKLTKFNNTIQDVAFRLWLYQRSFMLNPVTRDGTQYEIGWARRADRIGYLDFDTFSIGTDCAESQAYIGLGQSLLFTIDSGNSLFGVVQTLAPYNAVSLEEFDIFLHISQD